MIVSAAQGRQTQEGPRGQLGRDETVGRGMTFALTSRVVEEVEDNLVG